MLQGGSQFWLHVGNCFFDLPFVVFVILIIIHGLPGGPCPSAWLQTKVLLFTHGKTVCSCPPVNYKASLVTQSVKKLPAMRETQVQFLGQEDPLEKEMATDSSILGESQGQSSLGRLQSMGSQESDMTQQLNHHQNHLWTREINTPFPKAGHSQRCLQDWRPFRFISPLLLPLSSAFWL